MLLQAGAGQREPSYKVNCQAVTRFTLISNLTTTTIIESNYGNPRKDTQHTEAINQQMHKNRVTSSGARMLENKDTTGWSDTRTQIQWSHQVQRRRWEIGHHGNQPEDRPATLQSRRNKCNSSPLIWLQTTWRTYLKISIFTNRSGNHRIITSEAIGIGGRHICD